jgi:hypothetical protein
MSKEKYLIDSNSLITPYESFYPFDFAQIFWTQLGVHILSGSVVILDIVHDEILRGGDSLSEWLSGLEDQEIVDHRQSAILQKYQEILTHLQTNPCYKPNALAEWSREDIADAFLIATAATYGYTLITFETPNAGLNSRDPSKEAKIPDVAKVFDVPTHNLYYLMRLLEIKLGN